MKMIESMLAPLKKDLCAAHLHIARQRIVQAMACLILALGTFGPGLMAEESLVRMDLRLMGADLLDEMVYDWKKSPPFPNQKPMALAEVVAPLGLDDRFQILIENRLMELISLNPDLSLQLVRCSACSELRYAG